MNDDDMFGTPAHMLTRNDDPGTSHAAGQSVNTQKREKLVYDSIAKYVDGLTNGQVSYLTGISMHMISPRFRGLEQKHLIYYKGDTRTGKSGRAQRVARIERRRIHREQQEAPQEESQSEGYHRK